MKKLKTISFEQRATEFVIGIWLGSTFKVHTTHKLPGLSVTYICGQEEERPPFI